MSLDPAEIAARYRTVAVDFDGTLIPFADLGDGYRLLVNGEPEPGAREALTRLRDHGFRVVIHSSRAWEGYGMRRVGFTLDMKNWLDRHEIPYDEIHIGEGKPPAIAYIDDLAIRYKDNWQDIANLLIFSAPS